MVSPPSDIETQQSVCQKRKPGAPDISSFPCQSNNSPIERDGGIPHGRGVCMLMRMPAQRDVTVMRAETHVVWSTYVETEMEPRH